MADIRPFQGVHYNTTLVRDLARVICPPYDIIPPQLQQQLYEQSDYNFVRLEFGRELPQDSTTDNRYTRAAATMEKWLKQGILTVDARPSFYVADHSFPYKGKTLRRRSLYAIVRLEEWDKMVVRPHEGTLTRPKDDRLNLLWALKANTSPVMALYEDPDRRLAKLLHKKAHGKPMLGFHNEGSGESHQLWAITDRATIDAIREHLSPCPIYIADGHHRYESALSYRRARYATSPPPEGEAPFDFVLMALVDIADPGLVILPAHRLVRGMSPSAIDNLRAGLKTCFSIAEIPLSRTNTAAQVDELLTGKDGEVRLLLYGLKKDRLFLLTLRDIAAIRPMMPYFHSELYQKLDVSIVDHVILEELLGLTHEMAGAFLDYTNDCLDAIKKVNEQEYQLAVIVKPVSPFIVKAIADSGDRMPRKSTYFYPKIPAGLVFYRFT